MAIQILRFSFARLMVYMIINFCGLWILYRNFELLLEQCSGNIIAFAFCCKFLICATIFMLFGFFSALCLDHHYLDDPEAMVAPSVGSLFAFLLAIIVFRQRLMEFCTKEQNMIISILTTFATFTTIWYFYTLVTRRNRAG